MQQGRPNSSIIWPRLSGVLMLGVFSVNAYIGLKDTELSKLQPLHETANFVIAILDLVAASILLYYASGRRSWIFLSGVTWPLVYLLSLFADVESKMCLFSGQNCFSSVNTSFQYLILGERSQGWRLWPYSMITAIFLLSSIIALSTMYYINSK